MLKEERSGELKRGGARAKRRNKIDQCMKLELLKYYKKVNPQIFHVSSKIRKLSKSKSNNNDLESSEPFFKLGQQEQCTIEKP